MLSIFSLKKYEADDIFASSKVYLYDIRKTFATSPPQSERPNKQRVD
jgi:hypothetical protein